jgi:VanZ family protein
MTIRFSWRWWPVIGWAGVILALTSWPSPPDVAPLIPGFDKVVHLTIYAVLGYLVAQALMAPVHLRTRLNALTALSVFAFVDELHQVLIPGRSASLWDWAADLTGAALGLLLGLHLLSLARARQDLTT